MSKLSSNDVTNLDRQIEHLYECKPLPENEVKALCEKVEYFIWLNGLKNDELGQGSSYWGI